MFNIFKKKSPSNNLKSIQLKLSGLHCSSCAINIDLALEDLPSVESKTNYAKSICQLSFDPQQTTLAKIKSIITELGYTCF